MLEMMEKAEETEPFHTYAFQSKEAFMTEHLAAC
jgi:hypothetical protein